MTKQEICEHKYIGTDEAGVVECLYCGDVKDLKFKPQKFVVTGRAMGKDIMPQNHSPLVSPKTSILEDAEDKEPEGVSKNNSSGSDDICEHEWVAKEGWDLWVCRKCGEFKKKEGGE